jgi:hypothetical protein
MKIIIIAKWLSVSMCSYASIFKIPNAFVAIFSIDKVIPLESLYVYNIHNLETKHYSIYIAPVQSQGGLLVYNVINVIVSELNQHTLYVSVSMFILLQIRKALADISETR